MDQPLDIVSFAVPYPPNYGGVIDVYYRLKALADLGVPIRLHCFTYGGHRADQHLANLAVVHYYPRSWKFKHHLGRVPFIASSRKDHQLRANLASGQGPILFEGLHTCGWIHAPELAHRSKVIRMHNVEGTYYAQLARDASGLRAMHFRRESRKLKYFERRALSAANLVLAISTSDYQYFTGRHEKVQLLPAFHPYSQVQIKEGKGDYILVQGDLSIMHNLRILSTLAPICGKLGIRCVAAGRKPSSEGMDLLSRHENIEIYSDVSQEDMAKLMQHAHVHVIDAQTTAGFKLKLLASLFTARHVLAHRDLLDDELALVAHAFASAGELETQLTRLTSMPADVRAIEQRKSVLLPRFSNTHNARSLLDAMKQL